MSDESETRARSAAIHGANAARSRARACAPISSATTPLLLASASVPTRVRRAVVAANGSRTSGICPRGQTGKRFLPKRSFGSIHSTCLSALFTDRAMEAWYHPSIA